MNFEKWQEEMRKMRKPLEGKQNTNRHQSEVFDRMRSGDKEDSRDTIILKCPYYPDPAYFDADFNLILQEYNNKHVDVVVENILQANVPCMRVLPFTLTKADQDKLFPNMMVYPRISCTADGQITYKGGTTTHEEVIPANTPFIVIAQETIPQGPITLSNKVIVYTDNISVDIPCDKLNTTVKLRGTYKFVNWDDIFYHGSSVQKQFPYKVLYGFSGSIWSYYNTNGGTASFRAWVEVETKTDGIGAIFNLPSGWSKDDVHVWAWTADGTSLYPSWPGSNEDIIEIEEGKVAWEYSGDVGEPAFIIFNNGAWEKTIELGYEPWKEYTAVSAEPVLKLNGTIVDGDTWSYGDSRPQRLDVEISYTKDSVISDIPECGVSFYKGFAPYPYNVTRRDGDNISFVFSVTESYLEMLGELTLSYKNPVGDVVFSKTITCTPT